MTSIESKMIPKLRRAIGDKNTPYAYENEALIEYLEDAIDSLSLRWQHGYEIDRDIHTVSPEVTAGHQMLFVMQGKLDILSRQSDVSFDTGDISITRKSDNKKMLAKKIDNILNRILMMDCVGLNQTEMDDLEDWVYVY